MTNYTIQDIFEMRRNKQFEEAYNAVLPMYRDRHSHYTTICMFWTASDVMKLRIEAGKVAEAEQIFASIRNLYPNLKDEERSGARSMTRLALQLATKEQEMKEQQRLQRIRYASYGDSEGAKLSWEIEPEPMSFSLLDYMLEFGNHFMTDEDWQASEWNGHPVPSLGVKILSRIFHEVNEDGTSEEKLNDALNMMLLGLQHAPGNKHLLRYEASLMYRLGDKDRAINLYRQLVARSKDSYLFSELAGMVDNQQEQAALLTKAIMNQRTEVFAQKDRISLASLLKELFPQNAAYELQQVVQLRDSLGQRMNRTIRGLQEELANIVPVSMADQREFYMRMMQGYAYAA